MKKFSLIAAVVLATSAAAQAPQTPTQAALPEIGSVAPDFTTRGSVAGELKTVRLSDFRGKTVVIAFFPGARTSGCTVQLTKYRDEYASIFNGGKDVVVIGISTDADTTQASWAKDANFPFAFASDVDQAIGKAYGSTSGVRDARNVFVIGPDGKITGRMVRFNVNAEVAYSDLKKLVGEATAKK
jgi:peroxiredoxin Q/BCP